MSGAMPLPVWVIALIPLYLFVPLSSSLWRPYICTALGALGGVVSVAVYTHASFDYYMASFYAVAAIVGAATCFTGTITRRYFKPLKPSNKAMQRTADRPYA